MADTGIVGIVRCCHCTGNVAQNASIDLNANRES